MSNSGYPIGSGTSRRPTGMCTKPLLARPGNVKLTSFTIASSTAAEGHPAMEHGNGLVGK
eukprot:CAMPEP_0194238074 /NCGR_PEP_ID=MMETSP0158-20130606/4915_1 /TAXON_ID=33649 /ORGANISM="Thalassionema nitzschioides, Strain L26-B" /LENGTH=59 /DNA_ID=CAMNT_0038972245 /DNA_START=69 /DNA_END=248 /DNA_ORIENTATION=-